MPPPPPMLALAGFGIVGICLMVTYYVAETAYNHYRRNQYNPQSHRRRPSEVIPVDRRILGPCALCTGEVSLIDGFQIPCGHNVHYTCAANLNRVAPNRTITWRRICRLCRTDRQAMAERADRPEERVERLEQPEESAERLEQPEESVERLEQPEESVEQSGLRNRQRRDVNTCANCELAIEDEQQSKTMACDHHVHRTCWERMETHGMTTCPRCWESGEL